MTDLRNSEAIDCIIVGGGPAGLTAAIYLARYHLSVIVFDDGTSRAATIPVSHNHAGFPEGIKGAELLQRMRDQALRYGADIRHQRVESLSTTGNIFTVEVADQWLHARAVLLTTGVSNKRPNLSPQDHDDAVEKGLIRYCPVCDGFEITDQPVGVIGTGHRGFAEALFLRSYTKDLKLIAPDGAHELSQDERQRLQHWGIALLDGPVVHYSTSGTQITVHLPTTNLSFASIYPALGSDVRSRLAAYLGADRSEDGCILVDSHQRASIKNLYAAGDVVIGLDQISHAMGQAGVAATTIRNDLCEISTLLR